MNLEQVIFNTLRKTKYKNIDKYIYNFWISFIFKLLLFLDYFLMIMIMLIL